MFAFYLSQGQTYVFQEDFEGTNSMTSSSVKNNNNWAITTSQHAGGLKADSAKVGLTDTTYLTSPTFTTLGSSVVTLEFDQIAKVEFFDGCYIEVSNNNGATWIPLTSVHYTGTGQFGIIGNKFNATSYTDWLPSNGNAIPTSAWWKHETFNVSAVLANTSQAKIRFSVRDDNNTGAMGNYGWLLDNIKVWIPSLQEASVTGYALPLSLPSGCGLTNEVIQVKIANNGAQNINGNLYASFKREGLPAVTELVPNIIVPMDTFIYTFQAPINLSSTVDTAYEVKIWVSLSGDPNQGNDTISLDSVVSRVALPDPVISDLTIPYATSTTLHAIHNDSIFWYSDPLALNQLHMGQYFTTPILYDTTKFYLQATGALPDLKITEIVQFETGTGTTNPYPTWITGIAASDFDGVEITNLGNGPADLTGWTLNFYGTSSTSYQVNGTFTFPSGTILPSGGISIVDIKSASTVNNPSMFYFGAGLSGNPQSGYGQGYYLKNPQGVVVDAVASNSQLFDVAITGVTAADWSGNVASSSGAAGIKRITSDNNTASDWVVPTASSPQTFGSLNPGLVVGQGSGGSGLSTACPSRVVDVVVMISGIPANDAALTSITPQGGVNQGTPYPISVNLKNSGVDTLEKCRIYYSINDSIYPYVSWTGSLLNDSSVNIVLNNYTFNSGVYNIKAWTSLPNDSVDFANHNDTLKSFVYVCLSGSFTIGSPNADFETFADLQTVIDSVGLCGPTTIQVVPGIYNMQIKIANVQGISNVNTLTVTSSTNDPDDVTFKYSAAGTADNYVFKIDATNYVTLKNMTIKAEGVTYGIGIDITNGSSYNSIENCKISSVSATSSSTLRPISIATGNLCNFNKVINNEIVGGYYGIYAYGSSSTSLGKGNEMLNNDVSNFYLYGIYSYYQDSSQIVGNNIYDLLNTYGYGIYSYYNYNGSRISRNKVVLNPSSYGYGVMNYYTNYNNTTSGWCTCDNNMVSIIGGSSTSYGMYVYYADRIYVTHNSVNVSAGSTTSRALYQYGTTTVTQQRFLNNIWSAYGTGGFAAYFGTPTSIEYTNYNDYYSDGTYLAYWGANIANLAALQSASGKDANSVSVNPFFYANDNLHASGIGIYQKGLSDSLVVIDIDGQARSTTATCLGADEFMLYNEDAGITQLVSPVVVCAGTTSQVIVKLMNFAIDTLNSVNISWSVNGVAQTPYSYTGTLLPGQFTNITLGSISFNSGSTYAIKVWSSSPNGILDPNAANDTLNISNFQTALAAGTYSIGGTGADFATITAATDVMNNYGICGPVVFNVAPGTYNEVIKLTNVNGVSAVNTITFQSANGDSTSVVLQYSTTSAVTSIVTLDNVSYVTIKGIKMKPTGASYGRGVTLLNGANHNTISNCIIDLPVSTSSSFAGIYYSGSNHKYNTFKFNRINNGYYGLYSYGTSSTDKGKGNILDNNIIEGFYYYGAYCYYQDSMMVRNNKFTNGATSAYPRGIYSYYVDGKIEYTGNTFNLNGTSYSYGLYLSYTVGTIAARGLVSNNIINITTPGTTNTSYGMYCTSASYQDIYNNTIRTAGGSTSTRGVYFTSGSANNFVNNILYSDNYTLYVSTTTALNTIDYNCYYSTSTPLAYWSSDKANLAALQTASGKDVHSLSVNPGFVSATDLHLFMSPLDGMGTPLALVPIDIDGEARNSTTPDIGADEYTPPAQDINVATILNPTTPSCGLTTENIVVKVVNSGTDTIQGNLVLYYSINGGLTSTSANITNIMAAGDTLVYTFANPANFTALNDTTFHLWVWGVLPNDGIHNNDTIKVNLVNGKRPNPPTISPATTTYANPAIITASSPNSIFWYNSLASSTPVGMGTNYTTPQLFGNTYYYAASYSATNGCFSVKDSVLVNISNMPSGEVGVSAIYVNSGCGLDSTETVTIDIFNHGNGTITSGVTASFKVNNSAWITPETVTSPIGPGATISYTFTTPANLYAPIDTMYKIRAQAYLATDPYHLNDTLLRDSIEALYTPPSPIVTSPISVNYGNNATLTGISNDSLVWYADDTTQTPFAGGSPITFGPLYASDTVYASTFAGGSGASIIGTGVVQNTSTSYPSPFGQYYTGCREQYLIQASELVAAGVIPGQLSALAFNVVTTNGPTTTGVTGNNHNNFTIKLKNTNTSALTSTFESGVTQVYTVASYQTVTGWNNFVFNQPFTWDGVSNLLVETCFDNYVTGYSYSDNAVVNATATPFVSVIDYHSDGGGVCAYGTGTTYSNRPNMKLSFSSTSCASSKVPVVINVSSPPARDAGLTAVVSPSVSVPSNTNIPVQVVLKNFGTDPLTSTTITYKHNGALVNNYNWTGNIPFGQSDTVTVYTDSYVGGLHNALFYVTGANGLSQAVNMNDTISSNFTGCMSGSYTVGVNKDFASIPNAISAISSAGICGHITLLVDSGNYGQIALTPITGMDINNTITITSATGDSTDVVFNYAATSTTDNYTVSFLGGDFYRLTNVTVKASGASYAVAVSFDNGADNNVLKNCVITSVNNSSSYMRPVSFSGTVSNANLIENNKISGGYYGVYLYGSSATALGKQNILRKNDISGFYYYGVYSYYQDSVQIIGNSIHDGSYMYQYGIYTYYTFNDFNISGNNIVLNASSYSYALRVYYCNYYSYTTSSTKPGLVSNNFIAITDGSGVNYGLYDYYSDNVKYYNNSVSITGGTSGSYAMYQYNTTSNSIGTSHVNNSYSNFVGGYAAYFSTYASVSNTDYNNFYTTGTNLTYWNGARANLAAHKTASGKDAHSISVNPQHFTASNLHLSNIDLNGKAYPLADVATDIDGQTRNATTPDIGADEFEVPQDDAGVTAITSPTNPVSLGSSPVIVSIRNYGLDTLNNASIAWSFNNVLQTPYSWTGNLLSGNIANNINIGSANFGAGTNTLKVWTAMPNGVQDVVNPNDTAYGFFVACAGPLSGTFTLGGSTADFADFASAVNALNYCGVDSHVVFLVNNGTYNETINLGIIPGAADTATVTFMSVSGDSTQVVVTYPTTSSKPAIVNLNGTDWVTFKGMTLSSTGSAGYAVQVDNGATNNTFSHNVLKTNYSTSSSVSTIYSTAGLDGYNTFEYNEISGGYYTIYYRGLSTTSLEKGNTFKHNIIKDFYYYGVYLYYQDSLTFSHNYVTEGTSTVGYYPTYFGYCNNDLEISYNHFDCSPASYSYGLRVYYCTGTATKPGRIFNNNLSITSGTGASYGLYVYYSNYQDVAFNNVSITAGSTSSRGLYAYYGSNNRYANNNIYLSMNATPIYNYGNGVTYSDHNNFYNNNGTSFAYYNSTTYTDLATYQTASLLDSNSLSVNPGYYSATDLHVSNPALNASGISFINVTDDFDGDLRGASPDIGSDEFTTFNLNAGPFAVVQPSNTYGPVGATQVVEVEIRNYGSDTLTSIPIGYQYNNGPVVAGLWTGTLYPGYTANYTFTTPITIALGNNPFCIFTSLVGDQDPTDDTLCTSYTGIPVIIPTFNDNFDGSTSIWAQTGNLWQLGTPGQTVLNSAYSTPNAWMTGLSTNYTSSADANLYSPFFNFTGLDSATLSFYHKYKIASSDGGLLQYTTDGGQTWGSLGYISDPEATNWYNVNVGGTHCFSGTQASWVQSTYILDFLDPAGPFFGATTVQFRFKFFSNTSGEDEGWAIDNFAITLPIAPLDAGVTEILNPSGFTQAGSAISVKVVVKNMGSSQLSQIPVQYNIGAGVVNETINLTTPLATNDTIHYTFGTQYGGPVADYTICAKTVLVGDIYPTNDQTCNQIISTPAAKDAGIIQIIAPDAVASLFNQNSMKVVIKNFGVDNLHSTQLQYKVGSQPPIVETWTGNLATGDTAHFTFTQTFTAPAGVFTLCSKTLYANDANAANDELCKQVVSSGMADVLESGFALWQNYPNPVINSTSIKYEIPSAGFVYFEITDLTGKILVKNESKEIAGAHTIELDSRSLNDGVYFYSVEFNGERLTRQLIITR